jgi:hypothetical protein
MNWLNKKTPSEIRKKRESESALDYLFECLYGFSDKKIIWLAEKASDISNYKKQKKNGNN